MTVLSNIITPSNVLTTTNTATVTNKTLTSPTVTGMVVSDGTANGVTYLNGSKVLTTGSALTFDGTNLGVGVASPTKKLDILSNTSQDGIRISGSANPRLTIIDTTTPVQFDALCTDTEAVLRTDTNHPLVFSTNGTERMRLDSAGNLGIGASSPSYKLDVVAASSSAVPARLKGSASGNNNTQLRFAGNNSGTDLWAIGTEVSTSTTGTAFDFFDLTASANRMRIDSAGNLGLGVTPSAWTRPAIQGGASGTVFYYGATSTVTVSANLFYGGSNKYIGNGAATQYYQDAGVHVWENAASGTAGGGASMTERMRIDSSGNLLVGTTTSSAGKIYILNNTSDASQAAGTFQNNKNFAGIAGVSFVSGNVFNDTGHQAFSFYDGTYRFEVRSNGGIANYSGNNVNLSDRREKTNFAPATSYLDKICAIPVQTFNYIDQNLEEDAGLTLGVVAQDVQAVAPELVMESNWAGKDAEPKMRLSIYQTDLQYALMKCIQEQQAIIESLKARLDAANL